MRKRTYPADWPRRIRAVRRRLYSLAKARDRDEGRRRHPRGKTPWSRQDVAERTRLSDKTVERAETAKDIADVEPGTVLLIVKELVEGARDERAPPDVVAAAQSLWDEVLAYQPPDWPPDEAPPVDPAAAFGPSREEVRADQPPETWHRLVPHRRHLLWLTGLASLAFLGALAAFSLRCHAPVVTGAFIDGRPVSPERCTPAAPCSGLRWRSLLHFTIAPEGHAAVYLQAQGLFYLQAGDVVPYGDGGSPLLFPGEEDARAHYQELRLYLVTRRCRPVPRTRHDEGLSALPSGRVWGPVVLLKTDL
jgi:hypothetical protein